MLKQKVDVEVCMFPKKSLSFKVNMKKGESFSVY